MLTKFYALVFSSIFSRSKKVSVRTWYVNETYILERVRRFCITIRDSENKTDKGVYFVILVSYTKLRKIDFCEVYLKLKYWNVNNECSVSNFNKMFINSRTQPLALSRINVVESGNSWTRFRFELYSEFEHWGRELNSYWQCYWSQKLIF
jgi:hypothetical protein